MDKDNDTSPEATFEKFIMDFSKENKLVSEIHKTNELVAKISQSSLENTKRKVEGFYD